MYALVRALCAVKLTASDRIWPHMHAAGRSRFAPRIGHHQGAERYSGAWQDSSLRSRLRRALIVTPVTWTNCREHKVLGCEWGVERFGL